MLSSSNAFVNLPETPKSVNVFKCVVLMGCKGNLINRLTYSCRVLGQVPVSAGISQHYPVKYYD
jgi:hypothetical protein